MTEPVTLPSTDFLEDGFDPVADLLVGGEQRPAGLEAVNLRAIGPMQRALLVIDGTVTKFLEAVTMEPMQVHIVEQSELELDAPHRELKAPAGSRVIVRTVEIKGARTERHYSHASSLLVVDRLPAEVRERLADHPQGVGRILDEAGLETRREVLWYGRERLKEGSVVVTGSRICRTYRIISGGLPLMLINESFPGDLELND